MPKKTKQGPEKEAERAITEAKKETEKVQKRKAKKNTANEKDAEKEAENPQKNKEKEKNGKKESEKKHEQIAQENNETEKNVASEAGKKQVPLYFLVLAVITALLAGYAISVLLLPPPTFDINDLNRIEDKEQKKEITALLIVDKQCSVCEQGHSFLNILAQNNVPAKYAELSSGSAEGKRAIRDFNISELPALLIIKDSVDEKITASLGDGRKVSLKETLARIADDKLGYFVLEEHNYDGKAHTVTLTETSCAQPDLVTVDLFEDPYSPNTVKFKQETWGARKQFDKNVAFNYIYLPTTSDALPPQLKENAEYLAEALVCSVDLRKFNELEELFFTRYCDRNDNNALEGNELANCSGETAIPPLTREEVDKLLQETGIKPEIFDICRKTRVIDYTVGFEQKISLFLVTSTPTAVINCKYKTHPKFLPEVICYEKPDLEGCKIQ